MHSKNNVHTVIYCIVSIVVSNVLNSSTYVRTVFTVSYPNLKYETHLSVLRYYICNELIDGPVPLLNNEIMNSTSIYHSINARINGVVTSNVPRWYLTCLESNPLYIMHIVLWTVILIFRWVTVTF
jgi:hypothetical protein